jgi:hypothetical protein
MPAVISAFRKGRLSKGYLRFGQTWRTIVTGNHGTVAAVLTVLGLLFAAIPAVRHMLTEYLLKFQIAPVTVQVVLIFLSATVGSAFFISYLALRSMPPQDYARIMIGGRPASETLQVISREIENACKAFLDAEEHLTKSEPEPKAIDKLKMQFARQHRALLNISALLDLASQELDIPLPKLRDFVFEYDPAMHRRYFQRAIQNSELISELPQLPVRRDELLSENKWIFGSAKRIIRAQEAILTYTAIFPRILQVAATHSTSDATGRYASAVSYVAKQVSDSIPSGGRWGKRHKQKFVDGLHALRFLARKQRAHPGFDLHQSCIRAFQEAKRRADAPISPPEEMEQILSILEEKLNQPTEAKDVDFWEGHLKKMAALIELSGNIDEGFVRWRSLLVERFQNLYLGWCGKENDDTTCQKNQKTLLVTHGFSATVREVFNRGLLTEDQLKKTLPHHKIPNIFVINSGEKADLDSRLMVRDLLANNGQDGFVANVPQRRRFDNIMAGHEDALASLLDKSTRVMLVLGAECFDQKGRVLHPWGLKDHGFRRKLRGAAEVSVIVVAEGYKFQEDLLSISESYRYHFDRIRLCEPKFVDAFVTTGIVMKNTPDRRKKVPRASGQVPYERRISGSSWLGLERRGSGTLTRAARGTGKDLRNKETRVRNILRRPWDHLDINRTVKKHEFDLSAPPFASGE